jgi:hypothetical protein
MKGGESMFKKLTTTLLITAMLLAALPIRTYASAELTDDEFERLVMASIVAGGISITDMESFQALKEYVTEFMYIENPYIKETVKTVWRGDLIGVSVEGLKYIWDSAASSIANRVAGQINTGPLHIQGIHPLYVDMGVIGFRGNVPILYTPNGFIDASFLTMISSNEREWQIVNRIRGVVIQEAYLNAIYNTSFINGRIQVTRNNINIYNVAQWHQGSEMEHIIGLVFGSHDNKLYVSDSGTFIWNGNPGGFIRFRTVSEHDYSNVPISYIYDKPKIDVNINENNNITNLDALLAFIETLSGTLDEILFRIPENLEELLGKTTEDVVIHNHYYTSEPNPTPPPHDCECEACELYKKLIEDGVTFPIGFNPHDLIFDVGVGIPRDPADTEGLINRITAFFQTVMERATQGIEALTGISRRMMSEMTSRLGEFHAFLAAVMAIVPEEVMLIIMFMVVIIIVVAIKKRLTK